MKKKIALLLAAVMTVAMVPATAFAKSDNSISHVVVMEKDKYTADYKTPVLTIEDTKDVLYDDEESQFELTLDGAEWKITKQNLIDLFGEQAAERIGVNDAEYDNDGYLKVGQKLADGHIILLSSDTISTIFFGKQNSDEHFELNLPIYAKVTGDEATITITANDTAVSEGTYRFARTTSASATVKINGKVDIPEDDKKELKPIIITETVAGALDAGEEVKLRLYGDFKFVASKLTATSTSSNVVLDTDNATVTSDEIKIPVKREFGSSTAAAKISITGLYVADDGAKAGDIAEVVVSGAGVEKTTLEVGTLVTYGVKFTVEDKKLPVFYSGRYYDDDETLKVTFKETIADSWWESRKTTLTFPEGIKVIDVNFGKDLASYTDYEIDKNVVTIKNPNISSSKAEWTATFDLSISPDFTGDITCTLGGPAVSEDQTVTVGEAAKAVTFEVESKDVSIDYRNVVVGDITIKEAFAGALEEDKEINFMLDEISFEKGTKVEIVEGDIELEDLDESSRAKGMLSLEIKKESYKTPATIKLTNVQVYLDRSLPAGSYNLKVGGDAIIQNYADKNDIKAAEKYTSQKALEEGTRDEDVINAWAHFDIDTYTLSDKYIEVVTAGRDKDDSSFTTKLVVTIGATTMQVGQKEVTLDVPAYIANGYTMLPVRAVADALSGNAATVLWDDATKTVTIAFGARIISMTIGSKTMNINGVAIQMNAVPVITNSRTFLPLRDLAYALGLTDDKIAWDEATSTVTLN